MKSNEVPMCIICNREHLPYYDSGTDNPRDFNQEYVVSEDMKLFFRGLNDLNDQQQNNITNDDPDLTPVINCKYIDIESFKIHKIEKTSFSILHLNIASLGAHKDELEAILSQLNFQFDVIGITETRIIKNITPNYDIRIPGYKEYSTPTEANKGGAIIYILEKHNSKPRKDLDKIMNKSRVLESAFAEIYYIFNHKND